VILHELAVVEDKPEKTQEKTSPRARRSGSSPKLSYKLKRELEALPGRIEKLENALERVNEEVSRPEFYQQDHASTQARLDELKSLEQELDASLDRWVELEHLANQGTV